MPDKITFQHVTLTVKKLLVFNCLFLAFMSLFRVFFFLCYSGGENFSGLHRLLFESFFLGLRFDLSTVAYINILVTLTLLLLWAFGKTKHFLLWARFLAYYYWLTFCIVIFVLVLDFGYFSYFKDHINVMIYGFFEDDTAALIKTILQNHLFPAALAIVVFLFGLTFYVCRRFSRSLASAEVGASPAPIWVKTVFVVMLVCLNALAARGSLRMFPLSPIYSEISPNAFINKLSVNGVFAFGEAMKSHKENSVSELAYLKRMDPKKAFSEYLGKPESNLTENDLLTYLTHRTPKNKALEDLRPNVVVVVMESFGANLLRYDSKDFDLLGSLRQHFESDYVFHNFLPAGIITIHALETMILNVVQRPFNLSVTQTKFSYNSFPTDATLPYKKAGYKTIFVYGGSLRWRQLDNFLPRQGFDEMIGEGYLPATAEKNQWGVYDEYVYDEVLRQLNKDPGTPKFIMIMTTTNQPPYSVPSSYKPAALNIPEALRKVMTTDSALAMKRFVTYQYANDKLGSFITSVKNSGLGKKTIIAATGDHNFWDVFNYGDSDKFWRYCVPFYLYVPADIRPKNPDTTVFGSHVDIIPTLYNLSLSDAQYIAMGKDLFDKNLSSPTILNSEGVLASARGLTLHDNSSGSNSRFIWDAAAQGCLIPSQDSSAAQKDGSYYNSAMTVAEHIIKKSTEKAK